MYAFAPSSAVVLGDWGADVIKVVAPRIPDALMGNSIGGLPDEPAGKGFMWEIMNRGKRSIGIDVSIEEGRDLLLELVAEADVFITNLPRTAGIVTDSIPQIYSRSMPGLSTGAPRVTATSGRRTGIRRLRPYGLLGPHRSRSCGQHGVGRVRPTARARLRGSRSGTFLSGAIAVAFVRKERTGPRCNGGRIASSGPASGWSPLASWPASYTGRRHPRFRHADLPNPR